MNGRRVGRAAAFGAGLLALVAGLAVGITVGPRLTPSGPTALGVLAGVAAAGVALWKLRSGGPDSAVPAPWTDEGAVVADTPEEASRETRVSGRAFAEVLDRAGERARAADSVEEGVATAREPLRRTLEAALVEGGRDRDEVETALAEGDWTDDPEAAAVLDAAVDPPDRSFRRRLRAWLFPERAVRRRTTRAVAAVTTATDEALPSLLGEDAPRTVPVLEPTLSELRRAADGTLHRSERAGVRGRPADGRAKRADSRFGRPDPADGYRHEYVPTPGEGGAAPGEEVPAPSEDAPPPGEDGAASVEAGKGTPPDAAPGRGEAGEGGSATGPGDEAGSSTGDGGSGSADGDALADWDDGWLEASDG